MNVTGAGATQAGFLDAAAPQGPGLNLQSRIQQLNSTLMTQSTASPNVLERGGSNTFAGSPAPPDGESAKKIKISKQESKERKNENYYQQKGKEDLAFVKDMKSELKATRK